MSANVAPSLFALPKKKRAPAAPVSDTEWRARAILEALWPLCARAVNHSMTQGMWRSRYKRIAFDMAEAGVSVERACAAHAAATARFNGRPVYSLRIVQDQLLRMPPPETAPTGSLEGAAFWASLDDGAGQHLA